MAENTVAPRSGGNSLAPRSDSNSKIKLSKSQRFWLLHFLARAQGELRVGSDDISEKAYRIMCELIRGDPNIKRHKIYKIPARECVERLWRKATKTGRNKRKKKRARNYEQEIEKLAVQVRSLAISRFKRLGQTGDQDEAHCGLATESNPPAAAA